MSFKLTTGYTPGAIGRMAELHASYYSRCWNFGMFFEAKVATDMSAVLQRYTAGTDGFWTVVSNKTVEGGIAIDGARAADEGAHLRWFIMSDALRHQGAGNLLMTTALDFCRGIGHPSVYLWTFDGLIPARHLYEKFGFKLVEEHPGDQWGTRVTEQKFVLDFTAR